MSSEEIKEEEMGNVLGGSDSKQYPEIIIRPVKPKRPRIDNPNFPCGGLSPKHVKPDRIIKPLVAEKSKHPAQPLTSENSES